MFEVDWIRYLSVGQFQDNGASAKIYNYKESGAVSVNSLLI